MSLRELLAALPDGALVPVAWLREQLGHEPVEGTEPGHEDELLTVRQLGARLHRSPSTVRAWVEGGRFAGAVKVGRGWLVPASSVTAFLDEQRPKTPRYDGPGRTITPAAVRRGHPRHARDSSAPDLGAWRRVPRSEP